MMLKSFLGMVVLGFCFILFKAHAESGVTSAAGIVAVMGVNKPAGAIGYYFDRQGQVQWTYPASSPKSAVPKPRPVAQGFQSFPAVEEARDAVRQRLASERQAFANIVGERLRTAIASKASSVNVGIGNYSIETADQVANDLKRMGYRASRMERRQFEYSLYIQW